MFGGDDQLLKSVRITDAIKVEVYQQGKRRKYALFYDSMNAKINNIRRNNDNTKSDKYDVSLTDDQVIEEALKSYNVRFSAGTNFYKIEQDPYKEIPIRVYGSEETPYYLNNGCKITIEWFGYKPNPYFTLGTSSTAKEAEQFNKNKWAEGGYKGGYISRFLKDVSITSDYDVSSLYSMAPFSTWVVPTGEINQSSLQMVPDYRDSSSVEKKQVTIYMPDGFTENHGVGYIIWAKDDELKYWDATRDNDRFRSYRDESVLRTVIEKFKSNVTKLHGISDYDLKLCARDTEYCKLIDYKSPLEAPNNTPQQAAINDTPKPPGLSQSKIKLNIQGLFDSGDGTTPGLTASVFEIKAKTNMPTFTVWTGEIPKTEEIDVFDDLSELDDEYNEGAYIGSEENAPEYIPEVAPGEDFVSDPSSTSTYTPDPNAKPGTVVTLPRNYSHTSEQGYNILNSQWIGDLIASAKSHIGHPTYDIAGTENGNLGCASAVSMIFYRAFGVGMKDGKAVKAKPTDIGSFGTKGTSEAAGWFKNASLYQKINWKDAQPGDIMNTARNFSTNKAGHIGVVVDIKDKNGSWAIISNSSKGFAGGGGGAVKQNYSVKAWQSVTDRNPSETFAFRYIGPKLTPGQTA